MQDPRRTDTAPGSGRSGPASAAFESPLHAGAEAERGCEAVGSVDGSPGGPGAAPGQRVGRHDGVAAVVEQLKGHPLFAHVTLTRSERSPIAALVTEMLEDVPL